MKPFVLSCCFLLAAPALAHTRFTSPTPRSTVDNLKTSPCGNVGRTSTPTEFTPGQVVQVAWEETIDHPGYFMFDFSPTNDMNFTLLNRVTDTQSGPGVHSYTASITIPMAPCEECTLRLIQYMTENPAAPSLYYSCADIRIAAPAPSPDPGHGSLGLEPPKPMAKMSGCGLVKNNEGRSGPPPCGAAIILLPMLVALGLAYRSSRGAASRPVPGRVGPIGSGFSHQA